MLTSARQSQEVAWKRRTIAECCSDSHTPSPETATQLILRCVSPLPLNWCCKTCVPTLIFQRSKNFMRPKNSITLFMMITIILYFRTNMNGISSCKIKQVLYGQNKLKGGLPTSLKNNLLQLNKCLFESKNVFIILLTCLYEQPFKLKILYLYGIILLQ